MMNKYLSKPWLLAALLAITALVAGCSGDDPTLPADAGSAAIEGWKADGARPVAGVVPPAAAPGGKSYAEWSALWWQWMASAPALPGQNPCLDDTGALIPYGQSGHVWFLAPNTGGVTVRAGTVPTGTMLFFSPVAQEASAWEGNGTTLAELRTAAATVADLFVVTRFEIDGRAIPIGPEFRVQSPDVFSLTVPEDNVFDWWGIDTPAGTYGPCYSDGYFIMIAPLSAGRHTIHYVGGIPLFGYDQDVTFELTVVGGGRATASLAF